MMQLLLHRGWGDITLAVFFVIYLVIVTLTYPIYHLLCYRNLPKYVRGEMVIEIVGNLKVVVTGLITAFHMHTSEHMCIHGFKDLCACVCR